MHFHQAPLARFGDTAANAGTLALLDDLESTRNLPIWAKTGAQMGHAAPFPCLIGLCVSELSPHAGGASVAAGCFRILLMPIDTVKTVLQVEGNGGLPLLRTKMQASGPRVLYAGALGAASATLAGHFPWFYVYNHLNAALPVYDRKTDLPSYLARNAVIGFSASACSDTVSNRRACVYRCDRFARMCSHDCFAHPRSIRVLKTTKQASPVVISYVQAARSVIDKDGVIGLFTRGLKTKSACGLRCSGELRFDRG